MSTINYKEAISKWTLIFKDSVLEMQFQTKRTKSARLALIRYTKLIFGATIFLIIFQLWSDYRENIVDDKQAIIRYYVLPVYCLLLLVELLLIKLNLKKVRGLLTIILTFGVLTATPTNNDGEFHPMVLSNIAAITVLSYHLCYNWIVSCIGIFIGIIIFVTYSFQQDTEYPLNTIISNFFIYYVLLALNNYTCESDNRKLCFLRWKSQKQEEQWKNILQEFPEGICIASLTRKIIYMNNKSSEMHRELINEGEGTPGRRMILESGSFTKQDGGKVTLEVTKTPLIFEEMSCEVSVARDLTELRRQEHKKLEEKYQSMLLCMISHELRTPLNGIQVNLENLIPNLAKEKCIECALANQELCFMALQSSRLLWYFVNGTLCLAQIQAKELEITYKNVNINECINECISLYHTELATRKLDFILEFENDNNVSDEIMIDELKFKIILISLLMNAIKYTYNGYVKVIAIIASEQFDSHLILIIEDTGIGIEAKRIPHLFQMFSKVQNEDDVDHFATNSSFSGIGFGLTVSSEIVKRMKGTIRLDSEVDMGTKVWVKLPIPHSRESPPPNSHREISALRSFPTVPTEEAEGKHEIALFSYNMGDISLSHHLIDIHQEFQPEGKILIVDDNSINCLTLKLLLKKLNIPSDSALNGLEGINKVKDNAGDYLLIFMDIDMPIMNGIEATEQLRIMMNRDDIPRVPIIAITAYASMEVEEQCYKAGIDQIYFKPISFKQIKECLLKHNIQFANNMQNT